MPSMIATRLLFGRAGFEDKTVSNAAMICERVVGKLSGITTRVGCGGVSEMYCAARATELKVVVTIHKIYQIQSSIESFFF
jgi:hypothetical protein